MGQPLRPFSAQRYDSGTGRTRSYDSAVDPGARALIADLRHAKAAAATADMGMGRIMTPPPPPPPRTPPTQAQLDPYEQSIERQGSFQVRGVSQRGCRSTQKGSDGRLSTKGRVTLMRSPYCRFHRRRTRLLLIPTACLQTTWSG